MYRNFMHVPRQPSEDLQEHKSDGSETSSVFLDENGAPIISSPIAHSESRSDSSAALNEAFTPESSRSANASSGDLNALASMLFQDGSWASPPRVAAPSLSASSTPAPSVTPAQASATPISVPPSPIIPAPIIVQAPLARAPQPILISSQPVPIIFSQPPATPVAIQEQRVMQKAADISNARRKAFYSQY